MKRLLCVVLAIILMCSVTVFADVDWSDGVITADGYGAPPQNTTNVAQANILARRAAVVDAQRNLLEIIQGVSVDANTTVENAMVTNDTIKSSVNGFLKGAKVVKENWTPEGAYHVVLQVKIFGSSGLAARVVPGSGIGGGSDPIPEPAPSKAVSVASYSGLVIDCRGMSLERAMAPAIYDEKGRIIYSGKYVSDSVLVNYGLCDYDTADAMTMPKFRAGSNPLIIKAAQLRDFNRNVGILASDGDKILAVNQNNGMLTATKVVFLIDN